MPAPVVGQINERGVPNNEWDVYWYNQQHANDVTQPYSTNTEEQARRTASIYYGSTPELGQAASDIRGRLKSKLDQPSGLANQMTQASNAQIARSNAAAGLGGVDTSARNIAEQRQNLTQANAAQQTQDQINLSNYQRAIGAGISGTEAMAASGAGRSIASTPTPTANYGSSTFPCLLLVSLGLMSKETYSSESSFVNKESLEYIGYSMIIGPIVWMIINSYLFARFFAFFANRYVYNMSGEKPNLIGKIIYKIGHPLCRAIAKFGA